MKILGNRVLVKKISEEKLEDNSKFKVVEPIDDFTFSGLVIECGDSISKQFKEQILNKKIMFSKYSPDTHDVEFEGEKVKIINVEDVLAIYE